jgi:hypothetical protein
MTPLAVTVHEKVCYNIGSPGEISLLGLFGRNARMLGNNPDGVIMGL